VSGFVIGNRRLMLIKSIKVDWAGHEARVGAKSNAYSALVVKSEVTKFFPVLKIKEIIILKI
jgi:hypothetical protein